MRVFTRLETSCVSYAKGVVTKEEVMGLRGPAPKPTAIRLMEGLESVKHLKIENEPKPSSRLPSCPNFLSGPAKAEWRRLAKELHDCGLLTVADRSALAGYCQVYGRWVVAERELALAPGLTITNERGFTQVNPLVNCITTLLTQMHRYMVEFGLTPAARTRIATGPQPNAKKSSEERKAARLLGA